MFYYFIYVTLHLCKCGANMYYYSAFFIMEYASMPSKIIKTINQIENSFSYVLENIKDHIVI